MSRFEEDDPEPVAVVRTLSDFALALTLIVLMLIGTHSAAETKRLADTRAAAAQNTGSTAGVTLALTHNGQFTPVQANGEPRALTAAAVAEPWIAAHPDDRVTIVLEFPPKTLAADLHRALLDLQSAFGTHLGQIDTVPQP